MMCMGLYLGGLMKMTNVMILAGVGYLVMLFASKDQRMATRIIGRVMGIVMMVVALVIIVNMVLMAGGAAPLIGSKSMLPMMPR
jgi:Mn2+/Fe2+ NRAMP family transporter